MAAILRPPMEKSVKYDAVIVGAGPAGAFLGYSLACQGVKVLIIDRKVFPRYKSCGGGLTRRALTELPFDISPVVDDYTFTANMLFRNRILFSRTFDHPIIGMVMLDRFDQFLVEKAVEKGAVFQDDTAFKSLSGKPGDLWIQTSRGTVNARAVAGADGVDSRVAKALGLSIVFQSMAAVEGEVYFQDSDIIERYKGAVHFDFGVIPEGYGWVFPKRDHLSMGLVTLSGKLRSWRTGLESYLKLKQLNTYAEINPLKGHLVPFRSNKRNLFAEPRGLIVGDATGFTDPLTGEGIFYALKGASIATGVLMDCLESGYDRMGEFNALIKKAFLGDLVRANRLSLLLYKFPRVSVSVLKAFGEVLCENQVEVIAGEQTYGELYKKVFNPLKVLSVIFKR